MVVLLEHGGVYVFGGLLFHEFFTQGGAFEEAADAGQCAEVVAVCAFGCEQDEEDGGRFGVGGVDVDALGADAESGEEFGQSGDAGMGDGKAAADAGTADLFAFEEESVDLVGLELHGGVGMGHLVGEFAQDFFAGVSSEARDNGLLFEDVGDLDHGRWCPIL